jgi:hypothetical protein
MERVWPVDESRDNKGADVLIFRRVLMALFMVGAIAGTTPVAAAETGPAPDFFDDFDGTTLGSGWSFRDGYADALPADTDNHASYSVGDGYVTISIPGGEEHNQWWLRHAEIQRPFEGGGVYEIKVDSAIAGNEQVGISFETSPGTFMQFMLYGNRQIRGFVERFVNHDDELHKTTVAGFNTGLRTPSTGPFYLRVTLDDNLDPTLRTWDFEWSVDGVTWQLGAGGSFEGADATENIGQIQTVGVYAGNHPTQFSAFDARIDYFHSGAAAPPAPATPPVVTASASSGVVNLVWNEVETTDDYRIVRSTSGDGPFTEIAEIPDASYSDTGVTDGTPYYYRVAVVRNGIEGPPSGVVSATPVGSVDPPVGVPLDGLVLALDASVLGLGDGAPVSSWLDASGSGSHAVASGVSRPTYVASGIGGVPSVRFDGVDDSLDVAAGFEDFTGGVTMYVVASPSVLQSGFKLVTLGNGAGAENVVLGRAGSGSGAQYFTTSSAGGYGWFNTGPALGAGEAGVYSVVQPGGAVDELVTATVARDGVVVGSGSVYVPPVVSRTVNRIGRSYWSDGRFEGDIAEVLIYNRDLDAGEQATVAGYLATKYGLDVGPGPTAPDAPGGVSAVAGDGSVSVSWDEVADADGYRVGRADDAGGPFTEVGDVVDPAYVDGAVVNGTTYHYRVTAYGGAGESDPSGVVSATPVGSVDPPVDPPVGVPLDGLVLALDASVLGLGDGAPVSSWLDASGSGSHAVASGVSRPTYVASGIGGVPSVRFDGVDDSLDVAAGFEDFTGGVTMYVVASPSVLQSGFKLVTLGNGAGAENVVLGRAGSGSGAQYFTTSSAGGYGWFNTGPALGAGEAGVYSVVQPGGAVDELVTATVARDGVVVGSGSVYVPPVVSRTVNRIGRSYWSDGRFEGDIAEVLIYNRDLDAGEQATVAGYLATKYGLPQ